MLTDKKIRMFFRLHWIKVVVAFCLVVLVASLIGFISVGMNEWGSIDAISKQHTVAAFPFQLYLSVITGIFSAFVFGLMWIYFMQGGAARSFTQTGKTSVKDKEIGVYWHDVIGMEEAKKEAMEVVRLIREKAELEKSGAKILKGVLLLGPPGCGKTYLAKAIATETKLPFLVMSGSEFTEMFVGVGASRVRKLFKHARELAAMEGGCIIFIDEVDAVGAQRATDLGFGGTTERNTTLNQLLVEMDGLRSQSHNITVFAATNMSEKFLDPALLRPGRFDRKIAVDLPDTEDRQKLFEYYLSKINYDAGLVDVDKLGRATIGSSPAEIANIVQEAFVIAQRNKKPKVTMEEINAARERILLGIKRKFKMTPDEKSRLAFYEAGHILVIYLLVPTKDVFKATIIPRGRDIVSVLLTEKEEVLSHDKNLLLAEIRISLAGYACEKLKFGVTSNTSENDLRKATELAHNMVWRWGMGKSGHIGNFDTVPVAFQTREELERDDKDTIELCFQEINNLLRQNWDIVEKLAGKLIVADELDYDQIEAIFNEFGKQRPTKLELKHKFRMTAEEKTRLAFYEAGHILVTYLLVPTKDIHKASIIPRGKDIVSAFLTEKEEVLSRDKNLIIAEIRVSLAGYACEKLKLGVTSDIAESDLSKASELAHNMVWRWGMGKSGHVGNFEGKWVSHLIQEDLDRDVEETFDTCITEIRSLLRENWQIVEKIAEELLSQETLDYSQIEAIFKAFGKERPSREVVKVQERQIITTGVTWDDVIGMDEVKQEAREIVELIKDRARLQRIGGKIIKGLLMFGPPGCGKTYLASAMATEFELPFLYKSGSEFVEMYVGVGPMRIRRMFTEARELAQIHGGCVIFIDELDAIAGKRSAETGGGGQTEYNQTLNQLLVEMDGLKQKHAEYNIIVVGATNMPERFFDPAILRPGRFDRKLRVSLPNLEDREKLFAYYLSKVQYDKESVRIDKLARVTPEKSPADIANIVHEAAILTVRGKKDYITWTEVTEAIERIELGLRLRFKVTPEERKRTAYHEAGHAIITYLYEAKSDTFKLSIVQRERTLGVSWSHQKDETREFHYKEAIAHIMSSLGGYVAERLVLGYHSSGVWGDFENIMHIAHRMVYMWGAGESGFLGNFTQLFMTDKSTEPLMSEELKARLDSDVQKILTKCMHDVEQVLTRERPLLDKIANELVEKEELDYDQLEAIFKSFGKSRPTTYA